MNIILSFLDNVFKKELINLVNSRESNSLSTLLKQEKHSYSSSKATSYWLLRLNAVLKWYFFIAWLRTIFKTYAFKDDGFCGGIEFHTPKKASFTHSSESCLFFKMFSAILLHKKPYLFESSVIAFSERSLKSWIIWFSSKFYHLLYHHTYLVRFQKEISQKILI
mgnify:CR=1 FL=1